MSVQARVFDFCCMSIQLMYISVCAEARRQIAGVALLGCHFVRHTCRAGVCTLARVQASTNAPAINARLATPPGPKPI